MQNFRRFFEELAAALVHFAAECSATLVAEGIETEAELASLRELRVPRGQGWCWAGPRRWRWRAATRCRHAASA